MIQKITSFPEKKIPGELLPLSASAFLLLRSPAEVSRDPQCEGGYFLGGGGCRPAPPMVRLAGCWEAVRISVFRQILPAPDKICQNPSKSVRICENPSESQANSRIPLRLRPIRLTYAFLELSELAYALLELSKLQPTKCEPGLLRRALSEFLDFPTNHA